MNNQQLSMKEVLEKIKKCLALTASSNEHEAAAAMRQARALMEKYNINDADVLAAGATEQHAKSNVQTTPPRWEHWLAAYIARGFGCELIFAAGVTAGNWVFIGVASNPEIATYAFAVLFRQLKRHRAEYIKTKLKRCKTATKTRRADLFSEAWVKGTAGKIAALARTPEGDNAVSAYVAKNYPTLTDGSIRNRNEGRKLRDHEYCDYINGRKSGQTAELHNGMSAGVNAGLLK